MAISGSFTQPCPSCEANVPIKDSTLIGKKVDCPKCKYRFVVENPAAKDKKAVAADKDKKAVTADKDKKKEIAIKSKAPAKPKKVEVEEDLVEAEEDDAAQDAAAKSKPGKRPSKASEEEDPEAPKGKKKKKKAADSNKKRLIGIGLAGVGLVVLAVAALAVMGVFSSPSKTSSPGSGAAKPAGGGGGKGKDIVSNDPKDKEKGANDPKGDEQGGDKKDDIRGRATGRHADAENTNFLPPTSEAVYHCCFHNFLESPIGKTAFHTSGAFNDKLFQTKLGFSVEFVDDIVTAESFNNNWTFHVVHTTQPIKDLRPLIQAMGLKERPDTGRFKCYEVQPSSAAWLLALVKLPLFVPAHLLSAQPIASKQQPLVLHLRDAQTLIFAHEQPMGDYLRAKGKFDANPANLTAAQNSPPSGDPQPLLSDGYLTIAPKLREILVRVESQFPDQKVLCSTASRLRDAVDSGKGKGKAKVTDYKGPGLGYFRVRPIWDVVYLLDERTDRIEYVGGCLLMKDNKTTYTFKNSLTCNTDQESKQLEHDLFTHVGPEVVQFFSKVVGHKVELVENVPPPPDPTKKLPPGPVKDDPKASRIKLANADKHADFNLDLLLGTDLITMQSVVQLMAIGLKAEADIASGQDGRFQLAEAGKRLGREELAKSKVEDPSFPKGVYPLPKSAMRTFQEPGYRVSWMAGLLPYLEHNTLYNHINFKKSWRDGENWMAVRTLVPQFLDPSFPVSSHYAAYPGMPLDCAATHFVGIAGVGIDAVDAVPGDPKLVGKLGIFGYDRMTALKTIEKGRGAANTVLMIRVPFDGPAGVTGWMAGGGSTIRNVPDTNSLEPFLSTNAKGERGTFVLMVDGSVRYLAKGMDDKVFKAICTVDGEKPAGWDFNDENYPPLKALKEAPPPPIKGPPIPPGKGPGGGIADKPAVTTPTGWVTFKSKEGGFTISMPPDSQPGKEPLPPMGDMEGYKFQNDADKTSYAAGFVKLPTGHPGTTKADVGFTEFKKDFSQNLPPSTKISDGTKITHGSYQGREYTCTIQASTGTTTKFVRVYLVKDRFYILMASSPGIGPNSADYKGFFNSFKLTKP